MTTLADMQGLTQAIIASQEARAVGLAALRAATQAQLQECDRAHQAMAHQLRADLAQGEKERSSGVQAWLADTTSAHQAVAQGVQARLSDFHSAHQAMAQQQRESLAQNEARRSSAVVAWLGQLATARAAGHAEWQRMVTTLGARRAHAPAAGAAHGGEVSEEEAVARVPVGPGIPEFASLCARAFECLANRPDGTRLTELEQALGGSRIQMARVVRSLMDEGKAEKRGLLYYAV